ncbi:hypothetical protein CU097_010667 [Rhizopus azygosporus]|uniref:Uncharacterized protein n=1 Tax=Rhizopus azygosporus TaxID=86630 RepID=A0A367KAC1_RHIAZ|nr:hypothetical protein CU097_010667 [Rhizopus azygosporus]
MALLRRAGNNSAGFCQDISTSSETSKAKADEKEGDDSEVVHIKVVKSRTRGSYRSYTPKRLR